MCQIRTIPWTMTTVREERLTNSRVALFTTSWVTDDCGKASITWRTGNERESEKPRNRNLKRDRN